MLLSSCIFKIKTNDHNGKTNTEKPKRDLSILGYTYAGSCDQEIGI